MAKYRLDELLVRRGFCGEVIVGDQRIDKAGHRFLEDVEIRLRPRRKYKYVSRGGLKLEGALELFGIDVDNKVCLDLGASTGGFTDCLIKAGAARVYAVDVGYGLLDWALRQDERVINLERTHAGRLTATHVPEPIDIVVADISFNSLTRLLVPALQFMKGTGILVLLIKPQFEARKEDVGAGGIVNDPEVHREVCTKIRMHLEDLGTTVVGIKPSPIRGGHGNAEFLIMSRMN